MKEKIFCYEEIIQMIKLCSKFDAGKEEPVKKTTTFNWHGKEYTIEKSWDITLTCEDKRCLSISYSDPIEGNVDRYEYINCHYYDGNLAFEYESCTNYDSCTNGRGIDLSAPLEDIKELFDLKMSIKNPVKGSLLTFNIGNDDRVVIPERMSSKEICFVDEGIRVGDYHYSQDGKRIISHKGELVPSKEEIFNFDFSKTKEKIAETLSKSSLDEFTKNIFLKAYDENGIEIPFNQLDVNFKTPLPIENKE